MGKGRIWVDIDEGIGVAYKIRAWVAEEYVVINILNVRSWSKVMASAERPKEKDLL